MSKKKIIANFIIIVLLSFLTIFYLKKTSILSKETLSSIRIENYLIALLWVYFCFAFISYTEKIVYSTFCYYPYKTAIKTTLCGFLGSSVSPFKSAHYPLKAYAQSNSGLALNQILTGVTKCQIIFSLTSIFVYAIISIVVGILGIKQTIEGITFPLFITTSVGFMTNLLEFLFLVILSKNEKIQKTVLLLFFYLLKIFKRKLDKTEFLLKKSQRLLLFKQQSKEVFSSFNRIIWPSILYAVYMIISSLSPYVCYLITTKDMFSLSLCLRFYFLSLTSTYLTNVIPVPGGCIVAEYIFTLIFANVLGGNLFQVLLLWRVSTYYLPVIINFIIFLFSSLKLQRKPVKT